MRASALEKVRGIGRAVAGAISFVRGFFDWTVLAKDNRAVSNLLATILLIAVVVGGIGAVAYMFGGLSPQEPAPTITVAISDHPDPVNTGNFSVIKYISGDKVDFDDLLIVVRDANGNKVASYEATASTTTGSSAFKVEDVRNNGYFDGGDIILLDNFAGGAGTYTIDIIYKPQDAVIASKTISVS